MINITPSDFISSVLFPDDGLFSSDGNSWRAVTGFHHPSDLHVCIWTLTPSSSLKVRFTTSVFDSTLTLWCSINFVFLSAKTVQLLTKQELLIAKWTLLLFSWIAVWIEFNKLNCERCVHFHISLSVAQILWETCVRKNWWKITLIIKKFASRLRQVLIQLIHSNRLINSWTKQVTVFINGWITVHHFHSSSWIIDSLAVC